MKLICYILLIISFTFSVSYAKDKAATIDLDQPRPHLLQLMSVEVYPKKMDGKRWDPLGASGPDLFVQVFVDKFFPLLQLVLSVWALLGHLAPVVPIPVEGAGNGAQIDLQVKLPPNVGACAEEFGPPCLHKL